MVRVTLRKNVLRIRYRKRDLAELDELADHLGLPSRSRLVNIALQTFLDSCAEQPLIPGQKRTVNVLLDPGLKKRLDVMARFLRTSKAELIRIALKKFEEQSRSATVQENRELLVAL